MRPERADMILIGLGMAIKLPGIVEVMPDAVEAADNGSLGGHEGIPHPNGKDRVLLAKRLSGRNLPQLASALLHPGCGISFRPVPASHKTSCRELEDAADKGNKGHHKYQVYSHAASDNGLGRDRNRKARAIAQI